MGKNNKNRILILFVVAIVLCFFVQNSIKPSSIENEFKKSELFFNTSIPSGLVNLEGILETDRAQYINEISDIQDLLNESDLVINGSLVRRKQEGKTVNSTVRVNQIISGSCSKNVVQVFEPYYIRESESQIMLNSSYLPMEYGESYIIFLKKSDLYKNENQFNLVSEFYGKYPKKSELNERKVNNNSDYRYEDFKGVDLLLVDTMQIKKEIMDQELTKEEANNEMEVIKRYEEYKNVIYKKLFQEVKIYVKE